MNFKASQDGLMMIMIGLLCLPMTLTGLWTVEGRLSGRNAVPERGQTPDSGRQRNEELAKTLPAVVSSSAARLDC